MYLHNLTRRQKFPKWEKSPTNLLVANFIRYQATHNQRSDNDDKYFQEQGSQLLRNRSPKDQRNDSKTTDPGQVFFSPSWYREQLYCAMALQGKEYNFCSENNYARIYWR
jgi:hypothetical protein